METHLTKDPQLKNMPSFGILIVLINFLHTLGSNKELSLNDLSLKTVFPLAIT